MSNINKKDSAKWKPKVGGKYYVLTGGHLLNGVHKRVWSGSELDISYWNNRNCYKSKSEAEFVFKSFHGKF